MKHLDLFSGIGGFALACEWAGIETIGFVEIDKYCQKVLRKHWPDVPIVEDIRDVEKIKEIVANAEIKGLQGCGISGNSEEEIARGMAYNPLRPDRETRGLSSRTAIAESPAILVTAGFPCQPFSVAGKRGGEKDDRYLWPETLAVIEAIKPKWVLLENVTGITGIPESASASEMESKALKAVYDFDLRFDNEYTKHHKVSALFENIQQRILYKIIDDLGKVGYEVPRTRQGEPIILCVPACAVNAWHRRDRIWIVANSISRKSRSKTRWFTGGTENKRWGTPENGGTPICTGTKIPLTSQSRQASNTIPNTSSRESWQSPKSEGREDSGRGSKEVALADTRLLRQAKYEKQATGIEQYREDVTNTTEQRLYTEENKRVVEGTGSNKLYPSKSRDNRNNWWAVEPELGRVAYGIPSRVDRLKCLGNAIVPQVAYKIIKVIKGIERE